MMKTQKSTMEHVIKQSFLDDIIILCKVVDTSILMCALVYLCIFIFNPESIRYVINLK